MNYLYQFALILAISFAGEVLAAAVPLPIPASIYGILILFLCLHVRLVSLARVRAVSRFLIEILPVLFIPAAVGLMEAWDVLRVDGAAYLLIIALSTFLVFGAGGVVTERFLRGKGDRP